MIDLPEKTVLIVGVGGGLVAPFSGLLHLRRSKLLRTIHGAGGAVG